MLIIRKLQPDEYFHSQMLTSKILQWPFWFAYIRFMCGNYMNIMIHHVVISWVFILPVQAVKMIFRKVPWILSMNHIWWGNLFFFCLFVKMYTILAGIQTLLKEYFLLMDVGTSLFLDSLCSGNWLFPWMVVVWILLAEGVSVSNGLWWIKRERKPFDPFLFSLPTFFWRMILAAFPFFNF